MKRCPECRRDYYDDTLRYCLDDGTALLVGPRSEANVEFEHATLVMYSDASGDEPARRVLSCEQVSAPSTAGSGRSIAVLPFRLGHLRKG